MSDKLKPCPFCGGKAKLYLGKGAYGVLCTCDRKAFIHTYAGTGATAAEAKANAIAAWNTRADIADTLAAALRDMVTIAEFDKWDHALTGREMVIRDAKTALAAYEARK